MLFSSLEFLYLFLPLALGSYFLTPNRYKNLWLFIVSLIFYAFGEPIYILLMLSVILINFLLGLCIGRATSARRVLLIFAITLDLAILFFFKYYPLLCSFLPLPELSVSLPVGISFYTFQAISYLIDVYRSATVTEGNFIIFGTYISLFPQLIAGPILKYGDVASSLRSRQHSVSEVSLGIRRFCVGLSKKVILANGAGAISVVLLGGGLFPFVLGIIFFAFQIYYDFSGYSDMAIGLGRILGFDFPENFNYPYISKSITEFWRRWHITLSSWFRDYLYIPLGGNRLGRGRQVLNLLIVWVLTGLWHGASLNFLLWGLYFFLILLMEKLFLLSLLERSPSLVRHLYSLTLILVGWAIFSADTLPSITSLLSKPLFSDYYLYILFRNIPFLIILALGATPLPRMALLTLSSPRSKFFPLIQFLPSLLTPLALLLSTAYLTADSYNPFLYFRF